MPVSAHTAILVFELRRAGADVRYIAATLKCDHIELGVLFSKPPIIAVPEYMRPQFIRTSVEFLKKQIERQNASND